MASTSVSSDSASLEEVLTNLGNAIQSTGVTRESLQAKYLRLGDGWSDKRYTELGVIISDCLRALDNVKSALTQGRQAVSALAGSIAEYEELDLGSVSGGSGGGAALGFAAAAVGGAAVGAVIAGAAGAGGGADRPKVYRKSSEQKLHDLHFGMENIEGTLENYTQSLTAQGFPPGPAMDAVIGYQRQALRAELVRNINGDFSNPVPTLGPEDINALAAAYGQRGWANLRAPAAPRSLPATNYGFTTQNINGVEMRIYDDPVGTYQNQIHQQGNSAFGMRGTCGICSCGNLLTMAGMEGMSEDAIISDAMDSSDTALTNMDIFNADGDHRGGTSAEDRQEILARHGLPTYQMAMSRDRSVATARLSEAIRTGHGVIVSVDVARFWRNGQSGGHAITLLSVSEDGGTFFFNDTGAGRLGSISARDLGAALTGYPANVTVNIIR